MPATETTDVKAATYLVTDEVNTNVTRDPKPESFYEWFTADCTGGEVPLGGSIASSRCSLADHGGLVPILAIGVLPLPARHTWITGTGLVYVEGYPGFNPSTSASTNKSRTRVGTSQGACRHSTSAAPRSPTRVSRNWRRHCGAEYGWGVVARLQHGSEAAFPDTGFPRGF